MKRYLLAALILVSAGAIAAFAAEEEEKVGLVIRPYGAITLGVNDFLRGGGLGVQAKYHLGPFYPGVQLLVEYDVGFSVVDMPISVVLGLGPHFWLTAGWTIPFGTATLVGDSVVEYSLGPTFGLGLDAWFLTFKVGPGTITPFTEISFVLATPRADDPLTEGVGGLLGFLLGLKGYIGVAYELKP